jgi:hypothetical protein
VPTINDSIITAINTETSVSGGRKLVRLSNGWLVAATYDNAGSVVRFYKSLDNGATWAEICRSPSWFSASGQYAITSIGTVVYCICAKGGTGSTWVFFDAVTQTNVQLTSQGNLDATATNITIHAGASIAISDDGIYIHAAWAHRDGNATPSSTNLKYIRGVLRKDGTNLISWESVKQVTTFNNSEYQYRYPSIVCAGDNVIISFDGTGGNSSNGISAYVYKGNTKTWSARIPIFTPATTTHDQNNVTLLYVPPEINGLPNGRVWVAWDGLDSTDNLRYNIAFSYSDDKGLTWTSRTRVTTGNLYSQWSPSITSDKGNKVTLVWQGGDATNTVDNIRMSVWNGTSFPTITKITNKAAAGGRYPQTLVDYRLSQDSPMFVYADQTTGATKTSYYGAFTITTISVPEGSIGNKTNTDITNFLSYAITTDGTMGTVTEKINGVTVGTKTPTSGQTQTVTMTQAQWDAIKYGIYQNATGGYNTLTIQMGTNVWTYRFNKKLAATDDVSKTIQAVSDMEDTFLQSLKQKLFNKIGSGLITDSFDTMIDKVGGKRFKIGISQSSSALFAFETNTGTTVNKYKLTATDIPFKPSYVIAYSGNNNGGIVVFNSGADFLASGTGIQEIMSTTSSVIQYGIQNLNFYVDDTSFNLPTQDSLIIYNWIAIE